MPLDPRLILAQRPLESFADMQDRRTQREIQQQEAELRRQEIMARRDAIIDAQRQRNQTKPYDPVEAGHEYDLRVKQAAGVAALLEQATDPDTYEQAKQGIAQIVGPDYVQHLPPAYDKSTNDRLVAQGKALIAKAATTTGKTREIRVPQADGSERIMIVSDEAGQEWTGAPKTAAASGARPGTLEYYMLSTYGPTPTPEQQRRGRKEFNQSDDKATNFAAGDVTKLSPAGIEIAALNYKKNGVMPPLGMGDKGNRQAIINRAATLTPTDIARIESGGLDIAGNKADYKANADTLTALTKQRAAIGAFEQTAQKNIDVFLKQAEKVTDTGIPLLNTPARWISGAGGSADQAAYQAARLVAINEIAKITSNPTLAGQLSDSARHEVEAFNPQNATLGQTRAVMKLLKQDMQNRTNALDAEIGEVRKRIGGSGTEKKADPLGIR